MKDTTAHAEQLGAHARHVDDALRRLTAERVVERIWQKDASVWKPDEAHAKSISNWLGWLTATEFVRARQSEVEAFAEDVRRAGFNHVMLLGMGGSSLCPEVLRRTFGAHSASLELLVLDTTDPDTINSFANRVDLARTLFIVASKSGTTIEPLSLFEYFYDRLRELHAGDEAQIGAQFVAITDPGTLMEETARERRFRRGFLNPADIGGRYSALSLFGIVPAALLGLDVGRLLARAERAAEACRANSLENPAAHLGCALGALALSERNKLTLVTDERLASLGLWVEQLVAESTGKEGKGIVPVAGEPLGAPEAYSDDRLFVVVHVDDLTDEQETRLAALIAAGHPVVRRRLADVYDLGGEFFVWEFATAVAGWLLQINPFDQPNVQAAKTLTGEVLDSFKQTGRLPSLQQSVAGKDLTLYPPQETMPFTGAELRAGTPLDAETVARMETYIESDLQHFFSQARPGDYIALLAYLEETPEHDGLLTEIRTRLRDSLRVATTSGYGPRYLHSTGQLHKGGPAEGVFLVITDDARTDLAIPNQPYTFATLEAAQALGDFSALTEAAPRRMRIHAGTNDEAVVPRVMRLHLGGDATAGLRRLRDIVTLGRGTSESR